MKCRSRSEGQSACSRVFPGKRYAKFDTDADTHINILKDFKNTLPA